MAAIPVMLELADRRCVIVGGGAVALRRARTLSEAGALVTIISPKVAAELTAIARVRVERRRYVRGDLAGAAMAVIATDDPAVNDAVRNEATERGLLVNDATRPEAGDVQFMATHRGGPLTLAVHTGGASASAAGAIRDEVVAALDDDWPTLLREAAAMRPRIQAAVSDPAARRAMLRRLTNDEARRILKARGVDALRLYCGKMLEPQIDAGQRG